MPTAFTGGPYYDFQFVAATEQILVETFADILANAGWTLLNKVGAWASATPLSQPTDGTTVVVDTETFTLQNTPTGAFSVQIGATLALTCANFAAAVTEDSPTCDGAYDSATGTITVTYVTGGTFGNGKPIGGWSTWSTPVMYGAPDNALWLGGYQFQTNFAGGGVAQPTILPAIPCNVYFFQAVNYDWAWFTDGWGWPETGVSFQFSSADFSTLGTIHLMTAGPGASLRVYASPVQFFMLRTDRVGDPAGGFLCGGSLFVDYDPAEPPTDAWYSFGDWSSDPFSIGGSPEVNYSDYSPAGFTISESCFDGVYCGPSNSGDYTQITQRMLPGNYINAPGVYQQWGSDPVACEPFIIAGDSPTTGFFRFRGQLFDAMTVCAPFPQFFTSQALARQYPWSNGAVLSNGTPRNRLSADFDQATWTNVTANFPYASLFVVTSILYAPANGKANYVYEGKA